uniref:NADH dehydrogenase subunit 6 n=1 Tax=Camponotus concavus TaxID=605056 RepID=A0A4D6P290_9HYME|nr:NADH dehydrogenase subunit 6 [Camponotus concavus]QCE31805.1 NADH dehydrogenase subunit 6 [Camponotus concavus]
MMMKHMLIYVNYLIHISLIFLVLFLMMNISNHPIMIMVTLLIYSSMICLNMSLWKSNYILSIFLFLMMISGLLIIFLYFSSLISNEQFKLKINYYIIPLTLINMIFSYYLMNLGPLNLFIHKYKFHESYTIPYINKMNFNNILNLYEYPLNNLTILSMLYLLLSLFAIIKVCSLKYMSLRKIN